MTSTPIARLVVDANAILSAAIGGQAIRVFLAQPTTDFAVTAEALGEVQEYLPKLAEKKRLKAADMLAIVTLLPVRECPRDVYEERIPQAQRLIGDRDPDDVDTLALALALQAPIWTNDNDFEDTGVTTYTTATLLALLQGNITRTDED